MLQQPSLYTDFQSFIFFLKEYFHKKIFLNAQRFENIKNLIVVFLMAKRGKYQQSFLNTSFFLLVFSIWIAGPIITENNPLLGRSIADSPTTGSSIVSIYSFANATNARTQFSQKPRDTVVRYSVKSGDTLAAIAKKFDVSVDTIKWANNLKSDSITAEEKLNIPPVNGIVHKVQSGETIYSIAKKYNTDAQKIVNFPFNEFTDPDTFAIAVGQILIVPDGVPPQEKPKIPAYAIRPQFTAGQKGSGSFIWPTTGTITQYPVWYHMALDIANPATPPIIAADAGVVQYAGCLTWGYGCHIIINHANGYTTLYAHLSSIGVSVGQSVGKGQQIGIMGSTGRSTGTHLHFEIRSGSSILNPLPFLQ